MERMMSVEEKIRRAEEIYAKRHGDEIRSTTTSKVDSTTKDIKLLKKMVSQIIFCVVIYLVIYAIQNYNFIFSEDFIQKAKEILSYDTNFMEMYENMKQGILNLGQQMNLGIPQEAEQQGENQTENAVQENQEVEQQNQTGETPEQAIRRSSRNTRTSKRRTIDTS